MINFNSSFYLRENPDVLSSKLDPFKHFYSHGMHELRSPNPNVDLVYLSKKSYLFNLCDIKIYKFIIIFLLKKKASMDSKMPRSSTKMKLRIIEKFMKIKYKLHVYLIAFLTLILQKKKINSASASKINVIILHWKHPHHLSYLLWNLYKQNLQHSDITIVDNGSNNISKKILSKFIGINLIKNSRNIGYPAGVNQGLISNQNEYVLLLNDDAIPKKGWEKKVINFFDKCPDGILGAKIHGIAGRIQEIGNYINDDYTITAIGRGQSKNEIISNKIQEVDYVSGVFMAFSKKTLLRIGMFDERFSPAYYEDVDYCVRAKDLSIPIIVNPEIEVMHVEHGSTDPTVAQQSIKVAFAKFREKHGTVNTRQRLDSKKILFIDSLPPVAHYGQGAPRAQFLVNEIMNYGDVEFIYRQGNPESVLEVILDCPKNSLHLEGPLNDQELKQFLRLEITKFDYLIVSRIENLRWINQNVNLRNIKKNTKIFFDFEAVRLNELSKEDIGTLQLANCLISVCENDQRILKSVGLESLVIGTRIKNNFSQSKRSNSSKIVFLGNLTSPESDNFLSLVEYLEFLKQNVQYSHLLEDIHIYGSLSDHGRTQFEALGIKHIFGKSKIEAVFKDAMVFIIPSKASVGIPLKAFSALENSTPLVVSPLIQKQLNWEDGVHCFVGKDYANFSKKISEVINRKDVPDVLKSREKYKSFVSYNNKKFSDNVELLFKSQI